jgi:hypothetical protein
MFQFTGFASRPYGFRSGYPLQGGLPHSEIRGSTSARLSPRLFAACHVLHRLSVPRHPPDALVMRLIATRLSLAPAHALSHARTRLVKTLYPQGDPAAPTTPLGHRSRRADRLGHAHTSSSPCQTALAFPLHQRSKNIAGQDPLQGPAASRDLPDRLRRNSDVACIGAARSRRASAAAARRRSLAAASVVEVNGIEPMTSCLQSRRSPN